MKVQPGLKAFCRLVKRIADKILADEVTRLSDLVEDRDAEIAALRARLKLADPADLTDGLADRLERLGMGLIRTGYGLPSADPLH